MLEEWHIKYTTSVGCVDRVKTKQNDWEPFEACAREAI